jgi:hypothetical protein
MKRHLLPFTLSVMAAVALLCSIAGCRKDSFTTDPSATLEFSEDTLFFDTLFTTVGSTTRLFKVYNRRDDDLMISDIRLEGGSASQFRMNVDGDNGTRFTDVRLRAGDSLFVFVEVTIDPGNTGTPFIVEDNIRFVTNGNEQKVNLAAWGQDAYFHGGPGGGLHVLPCSEVWNNDKPHVVYGIVAVDEGCTLTINEGTQVYVHARSGIYVYKSVLDIQGSLNNEVVFQGDRLEPEYAGLPGQWGIQLNFEVQGSGGPEILSVARGGIWIYQSPGSRIDYAILRNGGMGIQVDTTGTTGFALELTNTRIVNMSGIGIWGQGGHIRARNVLVGNCGEGCAYLSIGGRYQMDNCTFADYWSYGTRTAPAFALNNYYKDINQQIQVRPLTDCRFRNCIMYGNNAFLNDFNEFVVDVADDALQQYQFRYCLVDTDLNVNNDGNRWDNMINQQPPFLCNPSNFNFQISNGASRMIGGPFGQFDLLGNETGDWKGCYDFTGNCN